MNPKSYRHLTHPASTRVRCPVCHEAVYSRAGIHPQCAARQAEQAAKTAERAETEALADPPTAGIVPAADHPSA